MKAARSFYQKLVIGEAYQTKGDYPGNVTLIVAEGSVVTNGVLDTDYGLKQVCATFFV